MITQFTNASQSSHLIMAPPLNCSVYIGTFLHSTSLQNVDILEKKAIGVDEHGIIVFIEEADSSLGSRIKSSHQWQDWTTITAPEDSVNFWFPGFIGMKTIKPALSLISPLLSTHKLLYSLFPTTQTGLTTHLLTIQNPDSHIHASQYPNAGIFGKTTLISWLHKYTFPLESSLSSLSKARSVYTRCIQSTLRHGTTTAAYYATSDVAATSLLAELCHEAGQRAFIGRCAMDSTLQPDYYKDASASASLASTEASIAQINALDPSHKLITPIITPRFAPSCTEALLRALGDLAARTQLPVQTHISENENEIALVKELFPKHASYTDVYAATGILTPRTVLAHACHLSAAEMQLIAASGAAIAHCPASNSYLGSGLCPVRELLDAGIPVGLGTDVSGGYSPSVLVAAREAGGVSRVRTSPGVARPGGPADADRLKLSVEETLFLATRGGSRCLGLQDKVGGFEVGMVWDAQFVDLGALVSSGGSGQDGNESLEQGGGGGGGGENCQVGNNWR
jgi:guanine deaminase